MLVLHNLNASFFFLVRGGLSQNLCWETNLRGGN